MLELVFVPLKILIPVFARGFLITKLLSVPMELLSTTNVTCADDATQPSWSPNANLLYFWSDRDGSPCLWAQRLDPATKRPTGEPLGIQHFHSKGLSWKNLYLGAPDIAVAGDKIVFNLGEHSGNIWMTDLPGFGRAR